MVWRRLLRRSLVVLGVVSAVLLVTASSFWVAAVAREDTPNRDAAPSDGRFVPAGDVHVFVLERGPVDGPPVVFVHGTGAWSRLWEGTLDALASEGYRAVALDIPPFGFSDRPADASYTTEAQARRILATLDALDLGPVTLVGHSFGSRAALEAALSDPARVARLVLVDPALVQDRDAQPERTFLRATLSVRPLRDLLVASTAANPLLTKTLLEGLVHVDEAVTPERVALLQEPLVVDGLTRDVGAWLVTFLAPEAPNLSNDPGARLTMPALLVWGAEDTMTPLAQGERLAPRLGALLVVLPGVGHIPQIEDPAAFDAALLDFLQ